MDEINKIWLSLLLILVIPFVSATDNYTRALHTNMHISIESGFDLVETGSNSQVEYVESFLDLYPFTDQRQGVSNLIVESNPGYSNKNVNGNHVSLKWVSPKTDEFKFKLDADISSSNKIEKISTTIPFPNSDITNSEFSEATDTIDITPEIREKATELTEGEYDYFIVVFKIAEWVKNNIKYDLNTLTLSASQKSSWVMWSKEGVCDEITNLFISMLRSVKIPAKFISGVVYSNIDNKWGNHGWAEVYFPGQGWVPFDVTLGQYGWIDSTHIKLQETADSSDSAVSYKWKSKNVRLDSKDLTIITNFKDNSGELIPQVSLSTTLFKNEVDFGSYVPLEVIVTNSNPYYVSTIVYIAKAPTLTEKNQKQVLLKPGETQKVYFIIKTPDNLETNLVYTSNILVKSFCGASSEINITYSKGYEVYTLTDAESRIKGYEDASQKDSTGKINFVCNLDKDSYYQYEEAIVTCNIKNNAGKEFKNLKACLKKDCKTLDLTTQGNVNLTFKLDLNLFKNEELMIYLNGEDITKYSFLDLKILDLSSLEIVKMSFPKEMDYKDNGLLSFSLYSQKSLKNIKMEVYPFGKYSMDELKGYEDMQIRFNSKQLDNGNGNIKILLDYMDTEDKQYKDSMDLTVKVNNVGTFAKIKNNIRKLFRNLI